MLIASAMAASPIATWPAVQNELSKQAIRQSLGDDDRLDTAATQPTRRMRFRVRQFNVPDRKAAENLLIAVTKARAGAAVGSRL